MSSEGTCLNRRDTSSPAIGVTRLGSTTLGSGSCTDGSLTVLPLPSDTLRSEVMALKRLLLKGVTLLSGLVVRFSNTSSGLS